MACWRSFLRGSSNPATSSSMAATPITSTTFAAPRNWSRAASATSMSGRERRRLGTGARLLHDDRRSHGNRRVISIRFSTRWRRAANGIAHAHAARNRPREAAGGTAEDGYLHCGPSGAGHFVKMVHNGIEYGLMAAYAEGLNILKHANVGKQDRPADAETAPLRDPERYRYDFNLAGCRRSVAARQRDRVVAARPDRQRAVRATRPGALLRPRLRFRRRPLDHHGGDRRVGAARPSSPRRSTNASIRAASPNSRTSCSRRCASSSAAMSNAPPAGRVTGGR